MFGLLGDLDDLEEEVTGLAQPWGEGACDAPGTNKPLINFPI
jgi:hypothetical protein